MATTTIPWGDGSGDNIYLTYTSASGNQTVQVSSDPNDGPARTRDITFVSSIGNISRVLTVTQETNMDYVSITWNDTCITFNDTGIAYPYVEEYIVFVDSEVEQVLLSKGIGDGIGIKPSDAAQVTNAQLGTTFRNNTQITSFDEFQYFTGLTSLSNYAFSGCLSLESIIAPPNISSCGQYLFYGCSALKDYVDFPGCNSISNFMYRQAGITSLVIPSHVISIGAYAFYQCTNLTGNVTIPATVTTFNDYVFQGCNGITSASIMCATVSNSTFRDCTSLTYVEIGSGCTSIMTSAFLNAGTTTNKCTFILRPTTPPSLNNANAFTAARINKIYVPNGTLSAYQSATNWSNFASYMAELDANGNIPT